MKEHSRIVKKALQRNLGEIFSRKRHPDYRLLWREYRSCSLSVKSDLRRLARYCAKRNE